MRNRIIAVAVLVVIIILLVGLVSCIVGGTGKKSDSQTALMQPVTTSTSKEASEAAPEASGEAASEASGEEAAAERASEEAPAAEEASEESDAAEEEAADSETADEASGGADMTGISDLASAACQVAAQAAAVNGVEDPWVPSGRFATGDAELDRLIKDFCDANSNPDLSVEENAFNAYCISAWYEFKERDNNQYPTGPTWDIEYAKQALNEGSVNCYEQVAFAEYVLKYFGYEDAVAMPSLILRQSGEYGDHGLLYVTDKDGRKCLCDPAFGANGWMLDADIYTVKAMDVGQDPSDLGVATFEEVVKAPWIDA